MKLKRREFLAATGAAVAAASVAGCNTAPAATPAPSPSPAPAKAEGKSQVAIVATSDRTFGVQEAIRLLGEIPVSGKKVLLKPNFNQADPPPASTHPDVISTLVKSLKSMGATEITIGERSGGGDLATTREVFEKKGIPALAKELGIGLMNFDETNRWAHFTRQDLHWKNGFHYAQAVADAECVVTTCCLKTHAYGGVFTLSLKCAVGMVARVGYRYMTDMHTSPDIRKMIAELNLVYSPALVVVDGVEAFTDGGPNVGKRVQANVVFAGKDRVAVDAVGVALLKILGSNDTIMKTPVWQHEQIARAVELGLGAAGPDKVELVTGDKASQELAAKVREVLQKG